MRAKAAKYFKHDGRNSPYWVCVWIDHDPDKNPQDFDLMFTPAQWRKMGCRTPKKNETIDVEICIDEVVDTNF